MRIIRSSVDSTGGQAELDDIIESTIRDVVRSYSDVLLDIADAVAYHTLAELDNYEDESIYTYDLDSKDIRDYIVSHAISVIRSKLLRN